MSREKLTTTSYAILGLLALREWSTYELAQQMARSMRLWWARAESRVYEEPKRLVRLGLATSAAEGVGLRPRTVYRITDGGRAALEEWLAQPAGIFQMEFEGMLKVFFADQGTKADLVANLTSIADAARADLARDRSSVTSYLNDGGPFPERLHLITLVTDLYERLLRATVDWADDAVGQVEGWPSTREAPDPTPALLSRLERRDYDESRRATSAESAGPS